MTPFYQAVLDSLAKNNADADLLLLKKLCVALEKNDLASTNNSVRELIGKKLIDQGVPTFLYNFVHGLHLEIFSRLVFLGLFKKSRYFRSWYLDARYIKGPGNEEITQWPERNYLLKLWSREIWWKTVDRVDFSKLSQQHKSKKIWHIWNLTVTGLLLDISYYLNKKLSFKPDKSSLFDYYGRLLEIVGRVVWEIQIMVQQMLDEAKITLEQGNSSKIEELILILKGLDKNFSLKIEDTDIFRAKIYFARIDEEKLVIIEKTSNFASGGMYLDAVSFLKNSHSRKVVFNFYDLEGRQISSSFPKRKPLIVDSLIRLRELLDARRRQIGFLLSISGKSSGKELRKKQKDAIQRFVAKEKRPLSIPEKIEIGSRDAMEDLRLRLENERRQMILKRISKKYRGLQTDDDWIEYLIAVFKHDESQKIKKDDIWKNIMNDLRAYFFTFTAPTKFNLDDFGKSYLEMETKLPRAITGQLLHDCGVYGTRLAYILLQVGRRIDTGKSDDNAKLHLEINFIVLPFHVGLIIKGKNLTSYVTHNNGFISLSKKRIEKYEERWKNFDKNGEEIEIPLKTINKTQFWAELSAPFYISGVNMPYLIIKIPVAVSNSKITKQKIWKSYELVVCAPGRDRKEKCGLLFNPKYPGQIGLEYLNVIEQETKLTNQHFVPIWNKVWFKAWHESKSELIAAFNDAKKTYANEKILQAKIEKFKDLRMDYINLLFLPIDKIEKERKALENAKESINSKLATEPNILVRGIQHTWAKRLDIDKGVLGALNGHLHNIDPPGNSLDDVNLEPPPFADENNKLIPTPM